MQWSPKVIWTGVLSAHMGLSQGKGLRSPVPAQLGAWGLPQHHVCYNYLAAGKLESLPQNLFTGAVGFFFSLPSHLHLLCFPHCQTGFLQFIHLAPEEYIGLGFGYLPALEIAGLVPSNPLQFAY